MDTNITNNGIPIAHNKIDLFEYYLFVWLFYILL